MAICLHKSLLAPVTYTKWKVELYLQPSRASFLCREESFELCAMIARNFLLLRRNSLTRNLVTIMQKSGNVIQLKRAGAFVHIGSNHSESYKYL